MNNGGSLGHRLNWVRRTGVIVYISHPLVSDCTYTRLTMYQNDRLFYLHGVMRSGLGLLQSLESSVPNLTSLRFLYPDLFMVLILVTECVGGREASDTVRDRRRRRRLTSSSFGPSHSPSTSVLDRLGGGEGTNKVVTHLQL